MKIAVFAAVGLVALLGWRVAELERQNYTMLLGACGADRLSVSYHQCLKGYQPRTSQWWNLFYGVIG